ncbi:MAG: hypothetical protein KTR30_38245 [Saprospiraceae bacterium]|nr:hypothetical protein [Saprospiraceae bacterium]
MKKEIPDQKIEHPFQVPDHFFETFQSEILDQVAKEKHSWPPRIKRLVLKSARYAATLLLFALAGKGVWSFLEKPAASSAEQETIDQELETIYSQISEQDLMDFISEEMEEDFIEQLDF